MKPAQSESFSGSGSATRRMAVNSALRIALSYVVFAALWIYFSDWALSRLTTDLERLTLWATFKGWVFVAVTGGLLFFLIHRTFAQMGQTRASLGESEARYRHLVDSSVDAILVVVDEKLVFANPAASRIFGARTSEELLGRSLFDVFHPDEHSAAKMRIAQVTQGKTVGLPLLRKCLKLDGSQFFGEVAVSRYDHRGWPGAQVVIRDVTERKRAEMELHRTNRALRTLSQCIQTLVHATNESQLLREVCRVVVESGGYRMAWVGFATHDAARRVRPVAQSGFEQGYLDSVHITWDESEHGRGPTGTAIRTGQPVFVRHIPTDPIYEPWRTEAVRRGYASAIALPLTDRGETFGALNIYAAEPDAFDANEVALLTELAGDLAFGIVAFRTRAAHEEAQAARHKSERRFRSLFESMTEGVALHRVIYDEHHRPVNYEILDVNPSYERILDLKREQVLGKKATEVYGTPEPPYLTEYAGVAESGRSHAFETYFPPMDRHFLISAVSFEKGQFVTIFIDISARKRTERALHELSGHLLRLQDHERRRIARELHDTTSQNLAALNMNLSLMRRALSQSSPRLERLLADCIELADRSTQEIRTLSYLLHPPSLDVLGLPGALREYVDGFARRSGVRAESAAPDDFGRLPAEEEMALFRVVQESLGNIRRHSGSATARISLRRTAEHAVLEVADEGHGIPQDKLKALNEGLAAPGVGIAGMRERMRQLGGRLEIESGPGGTRVKAVLPIQLRP